MSSHMNKMGITIFIAGIIILAINLRPAITAVGPIIGIIRDDLAMANWNAGLITSLPLLAFAIMSPIAPRMGNKIGNERTLLIGLLILLGGIWIRSIAYLLCLFIGTTLVGVGIAIINVILPSTIKAAFPTKIGLMTGLYTTSMAGFAAIGSGLSVPLTNQLGWKLSLASWSMLTIIGVFVWAYAMKKAPIKESVKLYEPSTKRMLRSGLAWQVTIFMGLQSFLFYVTISWLAEILISNGFTAATAGWFIAYMQFISLPLTFLTPVLASKLTNQKMIVLSFGTSALIGYIGLLFSSPLWLTVLWVTLIGFMLGSSISLALTFLGLRTENAQQAAELSGMSQSFGYLLASIGPFTIGFIFDITGDWNPAIITIIIITCIMIAFGIGASRGEYVLSNE
ncbi:MFS transporter [Gracilibacillus sp. YIM 98692]|uniref:CynX/NimT family MFS transporter n=1 Tax=Gracilibacillus sp. YIM 98692 TaxID=2663532 RepID=UPI0013CFC26D|nr:MFS transporter [Gracilibacillus sp. YIM 98692]